MLLPGHLTRRLIKAVGEGSVRVLFKGFTDGAIDRADAYFSARENSHRLNEEDVKRSCSSAFAGWATSVDVAGVQTDLKVFVDNMFPFSGPQIFIQKMKDSVEKPHVDTNGKVCFAEGSPSYEHRQPEKVLDWAIQQAMTALSVPPEEYKQEFSKEFQAYWERNLTQEKQMALVLLNPDAPSRPIFFVHNKRFLLLADDLGLLNRWLQNRGVEKNFFPGHGYFIWLDESVAPSDIPKTSLELASFLKARNLPAFEQLCNFLRKIEGSIPVLIAFETENGVAVATIILHEPLDSISPGKKISRVQDGWSSREKMPIKLLARRYFGNASISRLSTRRFDKNWLDFRTGNMNSTSLSNSHVCLIGCGSLGSNLAYLLARAGIGKLTLIDRDILNWDNVGRHLLGAEYEGANKAFALKRFLGKQLPHLELKSFPYNWQQTFESFPSEILSADVIVSTTGDWSCDEMLNLLTRTRTTMPPVIFGWLEEYGAAGQALAVLENGGCLSCGMTPTGRFKQAATQWEDKTLRRAGACGDLFQPFGITELIPVTDMVSRLIIDVLLGKVNKSELRTWLGDEAFITSLKGSLNETVLPFQASEKQARPNRVLKWTCDPECHLCRAAS